MEKQTVHLFVFNCKQQTIEGQPCIKTSPLSLLAM
jgi:hypothetical protein